MSNVSTKWILELVDKMSAPLKSVSKNIKEAVKKSDDLDTSLKELKNVPVNITAIANSFRALGDRMNQAIELGIKFQDGLADVQAITGVAGEALDRLEGENKTIGIVLCQNKSESVVEYTLAENNEQIFASKYKTVLPSKNEFKKLINEQK